MFPGRRSGMSPPPAAAGRRRTGAPPGGQAVPRYVGWRRSGEFDQRERTVPARRAQEVLPPGRGDEAFEPVVLVRDLELLLQVGRRLVTAHGGEEVGGRHENGELQLRLV